MSNPYLGEIKQFGFQFAPRGFINCSGQLLSISQNTALFSLLGTYYGGNGQTTFAVPDLRGRVALNQGQLPGGATYPIGQSAGSESVTLTTPQIPAHVHSFTGTGTVNAVNSAATTRAPQANGFLARAVDGAPNATSLPQIYVPSGTAGTVVALAGVNVAGTTGVAGGSQAHENRPPFLVINVCIATEGIFPSRN